MCKHYLRVNYSSNDNICLRIYIRYFFESNETTQVERRQEHIENHIKEAEKLDEIINVLEKINKNLDEGKN